jgi:hypothetical protein
MSRTPFVLRVRPASGADERRIVAAGRSLRPRSLAELARLAELLDATWLAGEVPLRVERRDETGTLLLLWEHQGLREDH